MSMSKSDITRVFGEFPGFDLSDDKCEELLVRYIDRAQYGEVESDLYSTKWFDYRRLHPIKASYLYTSAYFKAYSLEMKVRFDVNRGEYMRPVKGYKDDMFAIKAARHYSALWKGRQAADSLGTPYDFYCRTIMRWAEENNWRHLPRPEHMYSTKVKDVVAERWSEEISTKLIFPQDPYYHAANYNGCDQQDVFHRYIEQAVERRQKKALILSQVIDKYIPKSNAIEIFGSALIEEAASLQLK